jgi:hypothetical protein
MTDPSQVERLAARLEEAERLLAQAANHMPYMPTLAKQIRAFLSPSGTGKGEE